MEFRQKLRIVVKRTGDQLASVVRPILSLRAFVRKVPEKVQLLHQAL